MNPINLFLTIIMFVSTYPILFILYFSQISAAEKPKGSLFGIRCSSEWMPADTRENLILTYQKRLKRLLLIMALIPFVTLPITRLSIFFTIWMLWILALVVMFPAAYGKSFDQVKELKAAHRLLTGETEVSFYELKEAGTVRTLHMLELVPLTALNLGMALFALLHFQGERRQSFGTLIVVFALGSLLCGALCIGMDRMKTQVISQNSDVNINYARACKKLWKHFWLANCSLVTAFTAILLLCCLRLSDRTVFQLCMTGSLALCLVTLAQTAHLSVKKHRLDQRYKTERDPALEQDDEQHWIGGILYYNPQNRRTLVEKKFGIGSTINMATPAGKAFTAFSVLGLMLIPLSCVWLLLEDFTPINLTLRGETLVAEHVNTEYVIPLEEITSLQLLDDLPHSSKVRGTRMSTLEKGTFRNETDGRVEECLNPMEEVFLRVETADTIYYLGSCSRDATLALYERISELADAGILNLQ